MGSLRGWSVPKKPKVGDQVYAEQTAQVPAQENVPGRDTPDPTSGTQVGEAPSTPSAPTGGYNRQQFQTGWGAYGDHSPQGLTDFINANPSFATGITRNSPDKVTMPGYVEQETGFNRGPENLDLIFDSGPGGQNKQMWGGYGAGSGHLPDAAAGGPSASPTGHYGPGGGVAPGVNKPINYGPPQSPMIAPNGTIPQGIPYNPAQPTAPPVFQPTQAGAAPTYQPQAQAPQAASPFADLHNQQNNLIQQLTNNPTFDQNWINQQNEQQKELIVNRQQEASRAAAAGAAHRGVGQGGAADATQRRIGDEATRQLLQSNRDINFQATGANRAGQLNALQTGANITDPQEARSQQMDQFLRSLTSQEGQFGAGLNNSNWQFGTGLQSNENQFQAGLNNSNYQFGQNFGQNERQFGANLANNQNQFGQTLGNNQWQFGQNFGEGQRQFDTSQANQMQQFLQNMLQRKDEFGQNMGFNRDNANAGFEQSYINSILNGGY